VPFWFDMNDVENTRKKKRREVRRQMIKKSMRNKLIAAIFIGCLLPYCIGGIYLKSHIEKGLYNNSIENSNEILGQVSEYIDKSLINDMEEEVSMLSSLDTVKNIGTDMNNYLEYNADTSRYTEYASEKKIEEFFSLLKESRKTTNFIFFGTEAGGYMEYPRFSPSQSYDPRRRPWYHGTINREGVVISEPYITNVTNEMVVSFTKRVRNEDETVGVIGISVSLSELTASISRMKIGGSGYILVMSPNHRFLVSPEHPDWILKTPGELGLQDLSVLETGSETNFEARLEDTDCVFNSVTSGKSGWHIVSVMDKGEILDRAHEVTNILIGIYFITFIVIFLILYPITKRITKPILEISSVIRRMTDFNFDIKTDIKKYTNRADEIGIVSSAVVDMHDNYYELMEQVNSIDDEIKNIDIQKNNRFKLELSNMNPFLGVINSINVLLDKTYLYLDQLKAKNKEIMAKNEQLVTTEEELTAQLEEIYQQKEYINFLAYHDPLTELPNRRKFIEYLSYTINSGQKGAVILLDLDDFKGINDIRGHVFGDRVLEAIAKRFEAASNKKAFISRFGGDEFLFFIEYQDKDEIEEYVGRLSRLFDEKMQIDDNEIEIRYSMGIALFPEDSTDVDQLIMDADLAMYSVKSSGKNSYKFFDAGMMDYQIRVSDIEKLLRDAIKNDGFKLVYQPQVEIKTGRITGYEALLRLKDHNISPSEFIGIAEKDGLILTIGRIVTEKVMKQLQEWRSLGLEIKPVSINFSATQLHDGTYINFIHDLLDKYELDSKYLEIEITENIFLENRQITLAFLKQLNEMGIKIAIDDFGTGYSSLNYLTFLPVDIIKLDRSLNVKFLEIKNVKVMDSLISLVHSLGLTVVAEGIETVDQVKTLKKAYCDQIQGFYFSMPLEADEIPAIHTTIFNNY
jgi:diguanylate cyclase (GGDEF)-like protein